MTRPALLWVAALAAPLAWVAQLTLGYGIEEYACPGPRTTREVLGMGAGAPLVALTVVAVAVSLMGGAAALLAWRAVARGRVADPRGRHGFLAFAALLASALFLVLIVLNGAQLVSLEPCTPG